MNYLTLPIALILGPATLTNGYGAQSRLSQTQIRLVQVSSTETVQNDESAQQPTPQDDGSKVAAGSSIASYDDTTGFVGIDDSARSIQMTPDEKRFFDLTNQERAKLGQRKLKINKVLIQAARAHSKEMYDKDYFSHESPTNALRTPMKRYLAQARRMPSYAMVGENLFFCTRVDVNRGHQAFMTSKHHRENILNARYEELGVGITKGADGSFWVTEMFLTTTQDTSAMASNPTN